MAVTELKPISPYVGHSVEQTLYDCLNYGKNALKTDNERLVTALGCEKDFADIEFRIAQKQYEQFTGKKVNRLISNKENNETKEAPILYCIYQSFAVGETNPEQAHEIGVKLAENFLKGEYQCTVNTHLDKGHIHNHIYFNAVHLHGTKKYNERKYDWKHIREISDKLCQECGLSVVIPNAERRSQKYSKAKAFSFRDVLRDDIDLNLKKAKNYNEFLELMAENYSVDISGKYLKFLHKTNGQQKYFRSYSLGEEYSEESLRKHFTGVSKIPLTIKEEIIIRSNCVILNNTELTYNERLNNIKALVFTVGVLNSNQLSKKHGLSEKISSAKNESEKIKVSIAELNSKIFSKSISSESKENLINNVSQLTNQLMNNENQLKNLTLAEAVINRLRQRNPRIVSVDEMKLIENKKERRIENERW